MLLVKLLTVYFPFEEFILKWLPVSDLVYSLLRQLPDAFVICLMGALLLERLMSGKGIPIIGGKVDISLFLFVVWAFTTLLVNPLADSFVGIANIKALLRYVLLIYIFLMLNPSHAQIESLVRWLMIAICIQALIGLFQIVGGIPARDFLAGRHVVEGFGGITKSFTGDRFEGVNDLMGTMGDTISFAYFLMLGQTLVLFLVPPNRLKFWIGIALFFALIYLSGSRAATLVSIMLTFGYFIWLKGWAKTLMWVLPVVSLSVIVGLATFSNGFIGDGGDHRSFLFMFNPDYIEGALNQRLGIIVYLVPKMFFSVQSIVGFSPDTNFITEIVAMDYPMVPQILVAVLPKILEDVYWVALYAYYGLIGFSFFCLFLVTLYKRLYATKNVLIPALHRMTFVAMALLLASIPLNFLNQAFEVRTFSFYLWLICGIALVQRRQALRVSHY